jgi:hypothetical protein
VLKSTDRFYDLFRIIQTCMYAGCYVLGSLE